MPGETDPSSNESLVTDRIQSEIEQHITGLQPDPGEANPYAQQSQPLQQTLNERIKRLEENTDIEFIRRETRLIPTIINFWAHFKIMGGRKDLRSRAAITAILWRVFSPGTTAAAAAGVIVLLITALQALLLAQQNSKLDQQSHIAQAQVNAVLASQLGPLTDELTSFGKKACLSVRNLSTRKRAPRLAKKQDPTMAIPDCWIEVGPVQRESWLACYRNPNKCAMEGTHASHTITFQSQNAGRKPDPTYSVTASHWSLPYTLELPTDIQEQIVRLTLLARPYRFIDPYAEAANVPTDRGLFRRMFTKIREAIGADTTPPILVTRPLSPERGVLLSQLIRLGYHLDSGPILSADFSDAYASRLAADNLRFPIHGFHRVSLRASTLSGAEVRATFYRSDFPCSDFEGADLSNSTINGGDFSGANFANVKLPSADSFSPTNLSGTDFENAVVEEADFIERLSKKTIHGFEPLRWELVSSKYSPSKRWIRVKPKVLSQENEQLKENPAPCL